MSGLPIVIGSAPSALEVVAQLHALILGSQRCQQQLWVKPSAEGYLSVPCGHVASWRINVQDKAIFCCDACFVLWSPEGAVAQRAPHADAIAKFFELVRDQGLREPVAPYLDCAREILHALPPCRPQREDGGKQKCVRCTWVGFTPGRLVLYDLTKKLAEDDESFLGWPVDPVAELMQVRATAHGSN